MYFTDITPEHIDILEKELRDDDRLEFLASTSGDMKETMEWHIRASEESFAAVSKEDTLLAVLGIIPFTLLSDKAVPWIMTTKELDKSPRHLIRNSKVVLDLWLRKYNYLTNIIDSRHEKAIRWVKWMGS